ncbi:Dystroglycan-type cadherin-like protein [Neofusicoccum parvum]|uniref:Dystroglycan-type cadherin-like protein n=1 Tax=Neofusicoccum parvum TaxID=310453 RepID=A0ACB5SN90_9PEZI|nr:Dystroglycan-type cadherin-like protein [Neofusicoccum parvum]
MSSPFSPSALTIKKQQQQQSSPTPPPLSRHQRSLSRPLSIGKENDNPLDLLRRTPSPTKSFKSTITTSPFHRRARSTASPTKAPPLTPPPKSPHRPKTSLADLATITSRSSTGKALDIPSLDDLNHAALLRNSALASQQRRASRDGGGGKGLSTVVQQQLHQRDSIINRGRHIGVGRSASGAGGQQQQQQPPTRLGARAEWGTATGGKAGGKSKRWSVLDAEKDAVGGAEEEREEGEGGGVAGGAGLRIPLSMISNVGNNANLLAPDADGRPRTHAHGHSASAGGALLLPSGIGLGNSGIREEEAVRLGEAKAKRPVSVEGTNRYSSLRGLRETAGAAGLERAGGWKTGEVSSPSPRRPAGAKRPGTAERESSVLGNEAFL